MIIDTLRQLGLSQTEAMVFSMLIRIGPSFVAPIVRETKKHRQIIYNALESLERRKLISVSSKNGKKLFAVSDPDRLVVEEQQKVVLARQIKKHMEASAKLVRERVEVFSGPSSYEQGLADFRRRAGQAREYIVIGGQSAQWYEHARPFFAHHVEELKKLKKRGVSIQILFYELERLSAETYIKPYVGNPYICKIADEKYALPQTTWLTGEFVYFLTPTIDPLVTLIKSKSLSGQYRDFFWKQWSNASAL
jgi:sugar-specific transcriptional regulator TrmB